MARDIVEVRLYPDYSLVKYADSKRWEPFPEWGIISDMSVIDFIEYCQEKGEVWYQGQFTGYRR